MTSDEPVVVIDNQKMQRKGENFTKAKIGDMDIDITKEQYVKLMPDTAMPFKADYSSFNQSYSFNSTPISAKSGLL